MSVWVALPNLASRDRSHPSPELLQRYCCGWSPESSSSAIQNPGCENPERWGALSQETVRANGRLWSALRFAGFSLRSLAASESLVQRGVRTGRHSSLTTTEKRPQTSFSSIHDMSLRSSLPTISTECSRSRRRIALKAGAPALFSRIHWRANSPF